MRDEPLIDLRRTQLLAVDSNLDDAHRALLRAARIPTVFAAELRSILAAVAELERRVLASTESRCAALCELRRTIRPPCSGGESTTVSVRKSALREESSGVLS